MIRFLANAEKIDQSCSLRLAQGTGDSIFRVVGLTLLAACPSFQIDANFGATAAIAEMLIRGGVDGIHILPVIPTAWNNGSCRGRHVKGGLTVDATWRNGKVVHHQIHGPGADRVKVIQT